MDTEAQPASPAGNEEPPAERDADTRRAGCAAALAELSRRPFAVCALAVVLTLLCSAFVLQPFVIPSTSMQKTLTVGDRVLVDKLAYRFGGTPRRGDVVVFDGTDSFVPATPRGNPVTGALRWAGAAFGLTQPTDTDFVKRVIGVGGDRVTCCDTRGRIEVNGAPLREDYLYPGNAPSSVPFDVVVPRGKLWVMGDHRARSSDSRDHLGDPGGGMVPVDRVIGRAEAVAWPPSRWSRLTRPGYPGTSPAASHG